MNIFTLYKEYELIDTKKKKKVLVMEDFNPMNPPPSREYTYTPYNNYYQLNLINLNHVMEIKKFTL